MNPSPTTATPNPVIRTVGAHVESMTPGGRVGCLDGVLGRAEHIKALVAECADDLAAVNGAIVRALTTHDPPPGLVHALGQSSALLAKVQAVAVALADVRRALEVEIRARALVDLRFAAAEEQELSSRYAALHDVLTGLPNRALFNDRLNHGLEQARRQGWTVAVMFVDLDDFKAINDTHGHDAGDAVLQAVAQRLKDSTRGEDTVSRYGGDEFLYLLTGIRGVADVTKVAAKIIHSVKAPCNIRLRDSAFSVRVKASIGIAMFPKDGITAEELVERADAAMYRAKQVDSGIAISE